MKTLCTLFILLFVPSWSFASRDCSSAGGTCRFNCAVDEFVEPGYHLDCTNKQVCCTKSAKPTDMKETPKPAGSKELPKGTGSNKNMPQNSTSSSGEASTSRSSGGEAGSTSAGKGGQILVCSPIEEAYARADTLLDCGTRNATLTNLYEENYRLIQIISAKKILYYLEKK